MEQYVAEALDALKTIGLNEKDLDFFKDLAKGAIVRSNQSTKYAH